MIQKFKEVNPTAPTVGAALNKVRRCWYKFLPGTAGPVARDILNKYNLNISGWNDESVSGWREFSGRPGQFGYAAFDGVDDAAIGPIGSTLVNTYTLAATVFVPGNNIRGCIARVGDGTQGSGFGIGNTDLDTTGNNLLIAVESVRWITAKTTLGTGWFRIAMAVNNTGGFTVYVNGVQVLSEASGTGPNTPSSFSMYIGGYNAGASANIPRFYRGYLDNVTLYTKVLSGAEFKEDWKQEQQGFPNMLNWRPRRRPFAILAPAAVATTPVGLSGESSWDVYELPKTPVGLSVDASWDLRGKVGITWSAVWDTLAAPLPAGTLYNDTFSTPYDFAAGGGSVAGWTVTDGVWANPAGIMTQSDTAGSGFDKKLIHDGITFPQNIDITSKIRVNTWNPGGDARLGLVIGSDYAGSGVNFLFHSNQLTFMKNGVGWGTSAVAFTPVVGTWYRMRLRQDMSAGQYGEFQGKVWADADPEPLDWTLIESARGWGAADGSPGLMGGSVNTATASFDDFIAADPALMDPFRAAVGMTGSASWDVAPPSAATTPVGISGEASWNVRHLAGRYVDSYWDIHKLATVGTTATWDVATTIPTTPIGIGGTATWNTHTNSNISASSEWDVRVAVGLTGSVAWDTRRRAGATFEAAWNIADLAGTTLDPVGIEVSASWNVMAPVSVNGVAAWNDLASASMDGMAAWNVMAPIGLGRTASWGLLSKALLNVESSWDLLALAGMLRSASWNVSRPVSVSKHASWDNRIPVSMARSATWDNRLRIGISNGSAWGVLAPSRIAANASWHVRRTVGVQTADRWHNRVVANVERSASWSLRGRVGQTNSATWDVTTLLPRWPIGLLGTLVWGDRKRIGFDAMATWNDRLPRGLARTVRFNNRSRRGIYSSVKFHTRSHVGMLGIASWRDRRLLGITYQDRWNDRARVGKAVSASWNDRARVGTRWSASWNIRSFVRMSLSGTWRDLSRVGISGATPWNVRSVAGSYSHTYWNINNPVMLIGEATWDLRALAGMSGAVEFMTFRATMAGGYAIDPAEAAAYIEAQHGLNLWGSIPGPGSVRIDHDYPTADAKRATRGGGTDGITGVNIRIFDMNGYLSGMRADPADVLGRSLTGDDGRWLASVYLMPGEYFIIYDETGRFPVVDYLHVEPIPGREPPELPAGDINNPYYEIDYYLSIAHGWGDWGAGSGVRGPSPVDHNYGGMGRYTITRNGIGLAGVIVEIYPLADFEAGRIGERYRVGWSRTNAIGEWDWPVNLYPGRYVAQCWREGIPSIFTLEVV